MSTNLSNIIFRTCKQMKRDMKQFLMRHGFIPTGYLLGGTKSAQSTVYQLEHIHSHNTMYAVAKVYLDSEPQSSVYSEYIVSKKLKRLVAQTNCNTKKSQSSRILILFHFKQIIQSQFKHILSNLESCSFEKYLKMYFPHDAPEINHLIYVKLISSLLELYNITGYFHGDLHYNNILIVFNRLKHDQIEKVILYDFGRSYKSSFITCPFTSLCNAWRNMQGFLSAYPVIQHDLGVFYGIDGYKHPISSDMFHLYFFTPKLFLDNLIKTDECLHNVCESTRLHLHKFRRPVETEDEFIQRCKTSKNIDEIKKARERRMLHFKSYIYRITPACFNIFF